MTRGRTVVRLLGKEDGTMKRIVVLALLPWLTLPACAAVSAKQVADFLRINVYFADPMYGARATLYRALAEAPAGARVSGAATTLAQSWHIPKSVAETVIEGAVIGDSYSFGSDGRDRGERSAELLLAATTAAPQSPEVWAIRIHFVADMGGCGDESLRAEYFRQSLSQASYLALGECENWLPEFARLHPDNVAGRFALTNFLEHRTLAGSLAAARWTLDAIQRTAREPSEIELAARRKYWIMLGESGLGSLLLVEGDGAGAADREFFLREEIPRALVVSGRELVEQGDAKKLAADIRRQWLAALIAGNRLDAASAELAREPEYDLYLADFLKGQKGVDLYERYVGNGEMGLRWQVSQQGATAMRVSARFLAANRMESAAGMLRDEACNGYLYRDGERQIETELRALPEQFQRHWTRYQQAISQSRSAAGCRGDQSDDGGAMSSQLTHYTETPLTREERVRAPQPDYQGNISLPRSFSLVRAEREGEEIRAVCISPAVDPGGEVSPGGFWLMRSLDGGANWQPPLYLGFQYQAPYVVAQKSRVSMFAPGVLRLEAKVAELDPESISFPPVALELRREASDLYIDIPLADLERDTDGDGLTDLLEAKLATSRTNADTDGDGLSDRLDDFPQASARAEPHVLAPIIVDLLRRLMGYERAGIIEPVRPGSGEPRDFLTGLQHADSGSVLFQFVAGDASQFLGLRAAGQVIVLNDQQIAAIRARSGPFYPLSFPNILVDPQHTRALVRWSAGWTGGVINYLFKNGRWIGSPGSTWISQLPSFTSARRTSPG